MNDIQEQQYNTEAAAKKALKKARKAQADTEKAEKKAQADIEKAEHDMEHSDEYYANIPVSVALGITFTHTLTNIGFDDLPEDLLKKIFKDGRVFSHLIEPWLGIKYPITHIPGCKGYDFTDHTYPKTRYDEKTFTDNGCKFYPSNMIGTQRKFDSEVFTKGAKKLIYCIVSNINFPRIKIKFMRGIDLIKIYPAGVIPLNDHVKFFD